MHISSLDSDLQRVEGLDQTCILCGNGMTFCQYTTTCHSNFFLTQPSISVLVIACMVVMTTAFSDAIVPSLFPILSMYLEKRLKFALHFPPLAIGEISRFLGEELSATTTQLGALYGVTQIISVFATLLFIPVSHVHFKAIFCLSGAFVTSGVILFLFSPPDSYPLRITARILWGLGQAPNYVCIILSHFFRCSSLSLHLSF